MLAKVWFMIRLQALITREAEFPTGIMLEQHAIAIPHCEAIHASRQPFIC